MVFDAEPHQCQQTGVVWKRNEERQLSFKLLKELDLIVGFGLHELLDGDSQVFVGAFVNIAGRSGRDEALKFYFLEVDYPLVY